MCRYQKIWTLSWVGFIPAQKIGEEEFFDAVESALDRLEEELELKEQMKSLCGGRDSEVAERSFRRHRFGPDIERVTADQLKYAKIAVGPEVCPYLPTIW